jgi:HEAT repeat protein
MGDEAVAAAPALVSLLVRRGPEQTESWDSANRAARALSGLGHRAIPSLRPALCDQHTRIRYEAITALQLCAYDHAPGTMTELFKLLDDADPRVRQAGAEIMGRVPKEPELAVPRLARMLGDTKPSVRRQAAIALGRFGSKASNTVVALQQACSDAAPEVRDAAAAALTKVGAGAAVPRDRSEPGPKGER